MMKIKLKFPLDVRILKDCFTPEDAIDLSTGEPHPDAGKQFAAVGDVGELIEHDGEMALVKLRGESFLTEFLCDEITPEHDRNEDGRDDNQ
jgi:hypothetical protein